METHGKNVFAEIHILKIYLADLENNYVELSKYLCRMGWWRMLQKILIFQQSAWASYTIIFKSVDKFLDTSIDKILFMREK